MKVLNSMVKKLLFVLVVALNIAISCSADWREAQLVYHLGAGQGSDNGGDHPASLMPQINVTTPSSSGHNLADQARAMDRCHQNDLFSIKILAHTDPQQFQNY